MLKKPNFIDIIFDCLIYKPIYPLERIFSLLNMNVTVYHKIILQTIT